MRDVKVAVIGAGSYVFGASVLEQALVEHRLDGLELALMDVNAEMLGLMGGAARRIASELGLRVEVTTGVDRGAALDGADFVLCAVAPEIHRRFEMDCDVVTRFLPGHAVTEFGGIAGISYSLRQIAFITALTDDMKRLCPGAWLLDSANPLPRICQAGHENGVRTVGFCSVSTGGLGRLWHWLKGEPLSFPCTKARDAWDVTMAGLNHFSWLVGLRDRASGEDLLPEVRGHVAAEEGGGPTLRLARETGYLLMPGDGHVRDFLEPDADVPPHLEPSHGTVDRRAERLALLRDIVECRSGWQPLFEHTAWERPIDLVAAMAFGRPAEFLSLNLLNEGQIPNLPRGVFVETPAAASERGPEPESVMLPESVLPYCERTARVTDAIVHAARARSRRLLHEAVELDPTIDDKSAGCRAVEACIAAHADLLPMYGE